VNGGEGAVNGGEGAVNGGEGAGRSEPVLLSPGFLCGDESLRYLAAFLEASGHCPQPSGIARNIGCSERAVRDLTERVDALAERFAQRVALVGHSRGGLFARVLAHLRPDIVSGIVMLGSPWRDQLAVHPLLWAQAFALATLGTLGVRKCCEPRLWGGPLLRTIPT
jgi:triacylglycerol lipase